MTLEDNVKIRNNELGMKWYIGVSLIIIAVTLLLTVTFLMLNDKVNPKYEEIKCYDRWNNEIIGVTCQKDVAQYVTTPQVIMLISTGLLIFIGLILIQR